MVKAHDRTVTQFLASLRQDRVPDQLRNLDAGTIERFVQTEGTWLGRATLQHTVAHLRCFLRFLATSGLTPPGLDSRIDTPRLYHSERLPRTLPDGVLQEFYGFLTVHYLLRWLLHQAALEEDVDPDRLSFTSALRAVRRKL